MVDGELERGGIMPYIPTEGALTESLEQIRDRLSPFIDEEAMRQLDNNLHQCFNEMRMHIQHAVYHQIAKLIEDGKIIDPN